MISVVLGNGVFGFDRGLRPANLRKWLTPRICNTWGRLALMCDSNGKNFAFFCLSHGYFFGAVVCYFVEGAGNVACVFHNYGRHRH